LCLREAEESQFLEGDVPEGKKVGASSYDVWGKASVPSLDGSLYFMIY